MLWLMDGSGGDSHRKRLSLSWFPVMRFELSDDEKVYRNDERLAWSNLSLTL